MVLKICDNIPFIFLKHITLNFKTLNPKHMQRFFFLEKAVSKLPNFWRKNLLEFVIFRLLVSASHQTKAGFFKKNSYFEIR